MTQRQQKFAEFYAACGNVTQAALQAGYSETYARARAGELLENLGVAQYLQSIGASARSSRILTAQRRQELLSEIAADPGEDSRDRIRAIDTLNKMTGEYVVKVDASVVHSPKLDAIMAQLGGQGLSEND